MDEGTFMIQTGHVEVNIRALKSALEFRSQGISYHSGVPRGGLSGFNPPPEIPKALQNRAKLNPIVKTVKNC